ncbi:MAG: PhnD/SsuA/transferrin family substrate-binding protein [Gammaproteobacteria bacterium]
MSQSTLQIQPQASAENLSQQFTLIGTIDVHAVPALETLYILPPGCAVELDFAMVQRVNSMGLAQVLKLFEYWQKRDISIRVTHVNRMIGVLFKMTGLTRFLADATPQQTAQRATPVIPAVQPPAAVPPAPQSAAPQRSGAGSAPDGKLRLLVNAQSSQQMNGWYFFNTYLQRRLEREVHMELVHGAIADKDQRAEQMDIVFAKPFEATRLVLQNRFRPVLRPVNQTDEVTLLVRADDSRQRPADFRGGKAVTASPDNFVYLLGRFLLDEEGLASEHLEYQFAGHEIKALQMLLKGGADMLFMLSETYRGLSGLTRKMLRELDQSETAFAFHLFCVAPHCQEVGDAFAALLLEMQRDSQGRQVLADLGIEGWDRPTRDEIDMLALLFSRYVNTAAPQAQLHRA